MDNKWNELMLKSASIGDLKGLKKALSNKVDVNYNNGYALCLASKNNHFSTVMILVEHNANVNTLSGLPLLLACEAENSEIINYLLTHGANPLNNNAIALMKVINSNNRNIISLFNGYIKSFHLNQFGLMSF